MARRSVAATMPVKLWMLSAGLVLLSLAWGVLGGWIVSQHASAASDVVHVDEPLALAAQQMYESISDADVTATTTFLSGPEPPLASLQRYRADVAGAAADLARLKNAADGNQPLTAALAAFSAGLPVYTGYVAQAQTEYALGYPLTGGSFMQVASEEAHLVLLPAARTIYTLQDAALTAASSQATGVPLVIVAGVLAVVTGFALYRTQRWLTRRTHRVFNYGLVMASAALIVSVVWLLVTFAVARSDLAQGIGHGSRPAGTLAQASIDVQQARGDEILNLISRSGDTSFEQNFRSVRDQIGPGTGTLLAVAAAASRGQAVPQVTAAARDAASWYSANEQVYRLDLAAAYAAETKLVIGTGPGSSAAGYTQVESDISRAIADDLSTFQSSATAGASAFGPVEGVVIAAALLMAGACAWGLSRRLGEYR
ncbi:MAG: hypothetical protein ACLP8X_14750 [Streptosporangiaceae bacterium]